MSGLTYKVEEVVLELLNRNSALDAIEKRHWHRDGAAEIETIVARATLGEKSLEGCEPWEVPCQVTFSSGRLTAEEADVVQDAIIQAIMSPNLVDPLPDFGLAFFHRNDDMGEERKDTEKLRVRNVTFPFLALPV